MQFTSRVIAVIEKWRPGPLYRQFENAIILVLSGLIAVVILWATWSLTMNLLSNLILTGGLDPTSHAVFQDIFGRILIVIIGLEFKRSLLVTTERGETIVRLRTVVLIAMLAIVRKFIILDPMTSDSWQIFGLSAAILSLGAVYWLVRDQDRRNRAGIERPAA